MSFIKFAIVTAAIYFIGKKLYPDKAKHQNSFPVNVLLIAIGVYLVLGLIQSFYGAKIPGSVFERSSYETEIYVNAFPEGSKSTNYRVPATIEATHEEESDGERSHSWRVYYLSSIRLSSGRRVKFEDGDSLELNKKIYVVDAGGKGWNIELTNKPVK